ncbi:urease accessory protein UreD [Szabonella alba]|uniref:Urease accessory protein UreD n=1 Tax=Szabonella alba TaxID=2804194 RepID=A0A8K0V7W1_9RHOB|nr:urease accessory protein UreD [Szabonella alba]MBL4917107.1 urease accessory protein UreD [Szabonella alba]
MLDAAERISGAQIHQRSHGCAEVVIAAHANGARLERLAQAGSAKAILPRIHDPRPEVVFLNTSGGLTGGDTLRYALRLGDGLCATATTQTAERAYASTTGAAQANVDLKVGRGGWLDWLPQETILFQSSNLKRRIVIDLAEDAGCLFLETVILGRHAMGETITSARLDDRREIRRAGRPIWIDPLRLDPDSLGRTTSPALLGPGRAFATLVLVAPGAADALGPLRATLTVPGVEAAATAFEGRLVLRVLARDGLPLRRQIARAVACLRPGPLPRVWQYQD